MNRINIKIPVGGMYQEWMSLIDLVENYLVCLNKEAIKSA